MSATVSPVLQRLAALAILAILLAAAVTGVIGPVVSSYMDAERTIARDRAAIAHAIRPAADPETFKAELARIRSPGTPVAGMLQSANESLAAAELQNRLKSAIEAAHGELRSLQPLPAQTEGPFRRVTVRGQATVNVAGLRQVLYRLEAASPLLFVDNVEVTARPGHSDRPGAAEDPPLDLRFDVYGYMRAGS